MGDSHSVMEEEEEEEEEEYLVKFVWITLEEMCRQ